MCTLLILITKVYHNERFEISKNLYLHVSYRSDSAFTGHCERQPKGGFGKGSYLSMGALLGEPGGRGAPLLGP